METGKLLLNVKAFKTVTTATITESMTIEDIQLLADTADIFRMEVSNVQTHISKHAALAMIKNDDVSINIERITDNMGNVDVNTLTIIVGIKNINTAIKQ